MEKIKLFLVDDSIAVIQVLEKIIGETDDIKIVGKAFNGKEAIKKIPAIKPDVVLLDIQMPEMNGIEVVKYLMHNSPVPILMFSSLTYEGAEITNQALMEGAVDFMLKPLKWDNVEKIKKELIEKIRIVSRVKVIRRYKIKSYEKRKIKLPSGNNNYNLVLIGASTGGPKSLSYLISQLPENLDISIVIAQHMPETFTSVFASHLNSISKYPVKEVQGNEILEKGMIYIGKGNWNVIITEERRLKLVESEDEFCPAPSVDVLFKSAADSLNENIIGVVLTGMGKDGCMGAEMIKKKNGIIIAESEETAFIYGMPKAVIEKNLADFIAPLYEIPDIITKIVNRKPIYSI